MSEIVEASKSSNIKGYYKGFAIQITLRDPEEKVLPLLEQMIKIADWMEDHDFKPSWNEETNKRKEQQPVLDDLTSNCPIHRVPMTQKVWTNPKGEKVNFWSHSKQEDGVWYNCSGKGWKENTKSR
jgi:hypothetical protein